MSGAMSFLVAVLHPIFWVVSCLYIHYLLSEFPFKSPGAKDSAMLRTAPPNLDGIGLHPSYDISSLCDLEQILSSLRASVFPM